MESSRLLEAHHRLVEVRLKLLLNLTGPRRGAHISSLSVLKG